MTRTFASFTLALLVSAAAQAATTSTTLTVDALATITASGIGATGTATMPGVGNGTFSASLSLTSLTGATAVAPFTITISGGAGTLTGNLSIPTALLLGGATSGSGSAAITGGTGSFAGATGSFPSMTGTASGSAISGFTLHFSGSGSVTSSGGPAVPTPTITDVLDAGSYTPVLAQGSIFVVKGTLLSASGFNQFSFPLPTTSGGVKITFTPVAGGAGTDAFLVYTYNLSGTNQLAAILPSTLATGSYNVTVTSAGATSPPFVVSVVQRKIGLITQDSTGTGLGVIQNYISAAQLDVDRLTTGVVSGITISPAKPGQVLIAWATGMGPVTGGDNTASPGFNFAANGVTVRVVVGGVSIAPDYAGRAPGLAGADQINFTLPANVPTGCAVSFQVSVNGALSNPATIAIAPNAAAGACVQPGYTTQQLQTFDQGGSFTLGSFSLTQLSLTVPQVGTIKTNAAGGAFNKITGFQLGAAAQSQISTSGDCQVIHSVTTGTTTTTSTPTVNGLDAGAITLNGPGGSNITNLAFKQDAKSNAYSLALATEGISIPGGPTGTIVAGNYTLAGAGGKDIGKFNASLTLGSPITVTGGLPTTVVRSSGLTLNWTGGNSSDIVEIIGGASVVTGTGANATTDSTIFFCTTTAGQRTFTVPSSILVQVPAVAATATGGGGFLELASAVNPTTGNGSFTAPLTAGGSIDSGVFIALVGSLSTPAYQ